jgi:hypothetical protein
MSNLRLVYCFSKLLSDDDKNFSIILSALSRSVVLNQKFHSIKIYTDEITYPYLVNINVNIEVIDFKPFRFLDDIKIQTIPLLKHNEVLIDPDVFLYRELLIKTDCDLILERPEYISDKWYIEDYSDAQKFKFIEHITLDSKSGEVGNIGIIKFFNREFQDRYIQTYNKVREIALEENSKLPPFPKFSVLLGQLLLRNISDKYGYRVIYAKHLSDNNYVHLSGYGKYSIDGFIEKWSRDRTVI